MLNRFSHLTAMTIIVLLAAGAAPGPTTHPAELLPHGDFAQRSATLQFWKASAGVAVCNDNGRRYFQFPANSPRDRSIMQTMRIPDGIGALEISVLYRCKLKDSPPAQPAAQITLRFFDSNQIEFDPQPAPIALGGTINQWKSVAEALPVPPGARSLNILLRVSAGLSADVDVASISVIAEDAKDAGPYSPAPTVDGVAVRRDGDHTIFGAGTPTVWFIHPYVDVLGHDFADGIRQVVRESGKRGHPIAIGCAMRLDPTLLADQPKTTYVFSYKNIDYPLPAHAHALIFLNTWLRPNVQWPPRPSEHDIAYLGSRTLGNDGDGKAADKARWNQIAKDDPTLSLHVLDKVGYYLPLKLWTKLVLVGIAPATTQPREAP